MEHLITLADHLTPAIINLDEIRTECELFKNSGTTSDSLQLLTMRAQEVMTLLVENEDLAAVPKPLSCSPYRLTNTDLYS